VLGDELKQLRVGVLQLLQQRLQHRRVLPHLLRRRALPSYHP
jgi:hypothetical protein